MPSEAPAVPTESEFALLKKIARRAETGCPLTFNEHCCSLSSIRDVMGLLILDLIEWTNTHELFMYPAGHAAIEAGLASKPCDADGCDEIFEFQPDDDDEEQDSCCSDECEALQGARNAGEDLHDRMKEGL